MKGGSDRHQGVYFVTRYTARFSVGKCPLKCIETRQHGVDGCPVRFPLIRHRTSTTVRYDRHCWTRLGAEEKQTISRCSLLTTMDMWTVTVPSKEVWTLEEIVPLMFDKNTEQSVQFHAVPTGTSDVAALPEWGVHRWTYTARHVRDKSGILHVVTSLTRWNPNWMRHWIARTRSKCTRGECMSSALKHQRIRSNRSDCSVTLYVVSCSKDVNEREDASMCPYTLPSIPRLSNGRLQSMSS